MLEVTGLESFCDNVNNHNSFAFGLIEEYKIKAQGRDLIPE